MKPKVNTRNHDNTLREAAKFLEKKTNLEAFALFAKFITDF